MSLFTTELDASVRYLASEKALEDATRDPYWPKWDSPWWHMLLLYEMGEVQRIPKGVVVSFVAALNNIPLKIFPIVPEDMPAGIDPFRGTPCHCQLGTVYQVLTAWGISVDQELPWIRPWFVRYQMRDGGLNCDNEAYLVKDEVPSSMVGTIGAFEAMLALDPSDWTGEERTFVDRAAHFMIERKLMFGSQTKYNAVEQASAEQWIKPCFPRFYLYDVLRGLSALLQWGEKTNQSVPADAVRIVVTLLANRFPDDQVRIERQCYAGAGTLLPTASNGWLRRQPATFFPLLEKVSVVGEVSPYLSRQWLAAKKILKNNDELRSLLD